MNTLQRSPYLPALGGFDNRERSDIVTPEEIEILNAHGPFNHSVWSGRGITVTHEEGLTGRVKFLSLKVREAIQKHFTDEQLAQMSIVDVGCYDGWLLESLSDLPFGRMVGIEPRPENIERGRKVREILRIPSRVSYRSGTLNTLDDCEPFDIVLCMGVLHHLDAIAPGLINLRGICRRLLILETLCLPARHLTPELRQDAEMKDVVYRYKPHRFGITLQRYEGCYYPGSGVQLNVVNVPTYESLHMHLDVLGFHPVSVLADWESYREALPHNQRPINAVCVSAMIDETKIAEQASQEARWIEDYEARMATSVLPASLIVPLHGVVCEGQAAEMMPPHAAAVHRSLQGREEARAALQRLIPDFLPDVTHQEIVSSLPYCPLDKTRLEYAKHLLSSGNAPTAIEELQRITRRTNADWRSCYRAFYLLWRAAMINNDPSTANRFQGLCLTCNPHFPGSLFDSPPPFRC